MIGLTKSLGKELAQTGVLANAIAPAVIATPMNADDLAGGARAHHLADPDGTCGSGGRGRGPRRWLCSDECSFSTGAVYDISGGRATY